MADTQDSTETMATKPVNEHGWLQRLVGDWRVSTEMMMPDGSSATSEGTEKVTSLGGLWAFGEGNSSMPDGEPMVYKSAMGYDVSSRAYRSCWIASASSHLWQYDCELDEDGRKMTMNCVGPDMMSDEEGATANYRDVIEILDEDTRTLTSYGEVQGEWTLFMKATYTRQ